MSRSRSSSTLEPPRKSVELIDTGVKELESSDGEDHFSDASEGKEQSRPLTPSSPIPRTRVERVDDIPSHGQVPGSAAYNQRLQDAVPDEVEVIPDNHLNKKSSSASMNIPDTPGGTPIPKTVVEKVDPASPSHGDVPGTEAYRKRLADATPDVVLQAPEQRRRRALESSKDDPTPNDVPIPETIVTRVDSHPAHGEVEGTAAHEMRREDAVPDKVRIEGDVAGSPTHHRSLNRRSGLIIAGHLYGDDINTSPSIGDDFDEFEEGAEADAGDEFGDFDEGSEQAPEVETPIPTARKPIEIAEAIPSFPLLDLEALSTKPDLLEATRIHLDAMFPQTTSEKFSSLPEPVAISADSPIFPSERSRSLWKQLITPPPLQPPNWTKSRIRRLFLVSLGVPVDLDEILPPSKQKKLVLPDIHLAPSSRKSESDRALGSVERLKAKTTNESTGSVDSNHSATKAGKRRPKGPAPPPDLDLAAIKRICATTDEKLEGFTGDELHSHISALQNFIEKTSELLEYWLKRRDGVIKEKEAFEGVIENLVKHARRVRK